MNDTELVERARLGDTAAFGELVDRHRRAVYRAALAAVGSNAEADDVAQEAFVTAFQKLDTFRGESSFKTWLLTITWRKAMDRRKRLARWLQWLPASGDATGIDRPASEPGWDAAPPEGSAYATTRPRTPGEVVMHAELAAHVRRLVRKLPVKLRDALLLAGSGEYSYEEMAKILGAPSGTVKWRVAEARRLLKQKLARLGYAND